MTSLYLIRHAQTTGNADKRFQGRSDHPLTEEGYAQVARLAKRFWAIPLEAVYTSPLSRAVGTAEAIARTHGLTPIYVEELIEMDLGAFEGCGYEEIDISHSEELRNFFDAPHLFRGVGGGEDFYNVGDRVMKALRKIAARHPNGNAVAVTHGCALRSAHCELMGYPMERMHEVPWCQNTGVSHVAYINKCMRLLSIADRSHLEVEA